MNKHQKAVYKVGERRVGKEQIEELLTLSQSGDPEERLVAAELLCPCHVRTRIAPVWEALYRMMQDTDARVRHQAWHTIEDGGKPGTPEAVATLERILDAETDPRVRKFAEMTFRKVVGTRSGEDKIALKVAALRPVRQRGKCDFCGATGVFVDYELQTMIPTESGSQRAAWICEPCAQTL